VFPRLFFSDFPERRIQSSGLSFRPPLPLFPPLYRSLIAKVVPPHPQRCFTSTSHFFSSRPPLSILSPLLEAMIKSHVIQGDAPPSLPHLFSPFAMHMDVGPESKSFFPLLFFPSSEGLFAWGLSFCPGYFSLFLW